MLLMSTAVTLAAVCVTRTPPKNGNWFYASLLFISAGAIGAFASLDTFFFYMFHELALIPTFLLIGIWGSGRPPGGGVESHDLPGVWQLRSPGRLDWALS